MRDAFLLDSRTRSLHAFQKAYRDCAASLPIGAKPFCDDGNSFWSLAKVPASPTAQRRRRRTRSNEWVSIDDLVRVAKLYALTRRRSALKTFAGARAEYSETRFNREGRMNMRLEMAGMLAAALPI